MGRTGTTRRGVLAATGALAAGAVAGCSPGSAEEAAERERAGARLRRRQAAASRELRDRYDATLDRHPGLGERLSPLRASVAAHVTALAPAPERAGAPADAGRGGAHAGADGDRSPAPMAVPEDPAGALDALAAAERTTADARTAALLTAEPELARLLASLAAAGAAHAYLLTEGGR
ncbi:hypothetical protein [Streptomyces clavuligerus]|uniref:hypothetical protein n=1 Tax=Streptomyces clavuligerus TaxID=1901 RepID=UPI00020D958F|nr:hypothetical protein [Streptomyces clavuligerus]ANW17794.1 hypothetical protein BB341_05925 [Streptomyces clavuligerus]AXU12346.1 hypothetical protein D1794_06145 [Streptomyces clavuligerus]MBY6302226.1 hypothetical protein [Streptomyces clavuligerus]QCS05127.1 hypothetical protein CRV15_05565 [Streptomyces clavuligerus]QPJ95503.1 hypothetical protein GE265_22360 [Streptomyces clavuligerus]